MFARHQLNPHAFSSTGNTNCILSAVLQLIFVFNASLQGETKINKNGSAN